MVKEKRKARLNKGEGGEFIGFGAFADATPSAAASAVITGSSTLTAVASLSSSGPPFTAAAVATLSPIYTGSDAALTIVFSRIGQKRDAITKSKALAELAAYFEDNEKNAHPKKAQAEALSHFLYLYQSKLSYDNTPRIRALSVQICQYARERLPKAWNAFLGCGSGSNNNDSNEADSNPNLEIVGMLLCARADPASEVRTAANDFSKILLQESSNDNEDTGCLQCCYKGMWLFVRRILSYQKPMDMHLDLFQKGSSVSSSSTPSLSEQQKEELEERYERIVGTAIEGLKVYFQEPSIVAYTNKIKDTDDRSGDANRYTTPDSTKFLWKALSSNKTSLRRKTYALLSTVCQRLPWLVEVDKTTKLLTHSLSSEKEATNISPLLETVLAFIASQPKSNRSTAMLQYVKPLTKLFKKGCYGASASQWTPMVLPIVALLPSGSESTGSDGLPAQANVLTCVWEGRSQVVGVADSFQVAQAVAETAAFLLQNQSKTLESAFHEVIAKCWLHALQAFLTTTEALTGPTLQSHNKLGGTMSQGLAQFERTCTNKPESAIAGIANYFWNQEIPAVVLQKNASNKRLISLLSDYQVIDSRSIGETDTPSLLAPVLREKFHALLEPAKTKSVWVPEPDIYNLWVVILQLVPSTEIFRPQQPTTTSMESFVMNHILVWFVRHTSVVSPEMSQSLSILDTQLFLALSASDETAVLQWASILREIISAEPSLCILTECLALLLKQGWKRADVVASTTKAFSQFCIRVAQIAVTRASENAVHRNHSLDDHESLSTEMEDEASTDFLRFLLFCAGLGTQPISESLVGDDVIEAWCKATCPTREARSAHKIESNPVLETLIAMIEMGKMKDKENMSISILIQSWRLGGRLWDERVLALLALPTSVDLRTKVVEQASSQQTSELHTLEIETLFDEETSWHWASRAHRLLQLCSENESDKLPLRSLSIIGMDSIELWRQDPSPYLSSCLLYLMKQTESSIRWELFAKSETNPFDLFAWVLIHLSGGGLAASEADKVRRRADTASNLFFDVDFDGKVDDLESCIYHLVAIIKDLMQETMQNEKQLSRAIAVLSMLIGSRFAPVRPAICEKDVERPVDYTDVRIGDRLWYIANPDVPSKREECKIVKIHIDLPGEIYFTIQLLRDNRVQERQTVGERLRKTESDAGILSEEKQDFFVSVETLSKTEKMNREKVARTIVEDLLIPADGRMPPVCFELYNVAISQCGLVGGRGVGSFHYSVLQQLLKMQHSLRTSLADAVEYTEATLTSLICLGLALGSGTNVPSSHYVIPLMGLDVAEILPDLLKLYDNLTIEASERVDGATTSFLGVVVPTASDPAIRSRGFSLLFQGAARLFSFDKSDFGASDYLALKAMEIGQIESQKYGEGESIFQDSEAEAISALVSGFSKRWSGRSPPTDESPVYPAKFPKWASLPIFQSVMTSTLEKRPQFLSNSCRTCLDNLVFCLYCPIKRLVAMRLLSVYAVNCRPLYDNDSDDEIINPLTLDLLDDWSKGLLDEEAEELEDDVGVVAEWVCAKLMNDMELWHDDDTIDDDVAFGKMMSWLFFLLMVDTAAAKDAMHRSSFLAYISRCGAVNAILDLVMVYGNVGSGRKYKFDAVISLPQLLATATLEISKLASLVMFRTVEVFPTLSKTWWEMSCPGKQTGTVQEFVERKVSPQVLKTALESIQQATAFGQMQVKGSFTTGEITATYVQDDLTLSVIIQIPSSYPFRRADVDCSKTFGVPPARSRRWALMISQMINNQGGTLKDALLLWKENVDKEFEGVEPCPVCYSVLHVKSHKLPNLECNTCHNHFHGECLKEWFKSSNKNSCVICQQPWQGTKV